MLVAIGELDKLFTVTKKEGINGDKQAADPQLCEACKGLVQISFNCWRRQDLDLLSTCARGFFRVV